MCKALIQIWIRYLPHKTALLNVNKSVIKADVKMIPSNSSDLHFLWHIALLSTFFNQAYSIVGLFTYLRDFLNIFSNILTALCRVYIIIPRNVGPRNKRECFQHPPCIVYIFLGLLNLHLKNFDIKYSFRTSIFSTNPV